MRRGFLTRISCARLGRRGVHHAVIAACTTDPPLSLPGCCRSRKVTASALLEQCLDQYAKHNGALNAVIVTDIERAKKAAAASDRRLKKGKPIGPFDGVPMTAKESFDWTGTPSTWGDAALPATISRPPMRLRSRGSPMRGPSSMARPMCR